MRDQTLALLTIAPCQVSLEGKEEKLAGKLTGVVEVRTRAGDRLLWQPGDADPSCYEPAMARRR